MCMWRLPAQVRIPGYWCIEFSGWASGPKRSQARRRAGQEGTRSGGAWLIQLRTIIQPTTLPNWTSSLLCCELRLRVLRSLMMAALAFVPWSKVAACSYPRRPQPDGCISVETTQLCVTFSILPRVSSSVRLTRSHPGGAYPKSLLLLAGLGTMGVRRCVLLSRSYKLCHLGHYA
jgi:hypothetical protein